MILIVCVDDHNGMMFNHRRQSQDLSLIHIWIRRRYHGDAAEPCG